jgi:carbon-monoxide dehydrogenase large subunit
VLTIAIQSHSQGAGDDLVADPAHELGIDPARISVRHGHTESTAFGFGTFASRSMVMLGGAVARASRMLRDKLCRIGAHLFQCNPAQVRGADGVCMGPKVLVTTAEIGQVAHLRMDGLPPLLDATATYEPEIGAGVFSLCDAGAVVAVDPETGFIELLDFAVAEDCGTMVNPMIVEGQIRGGVARSIGTALYEEIPYNGTGQPLIGTLADYLLPGAAELPTIKIAHLHTPAAATEYGMKGMGEGGAVAPPAAIANAVRDALAGIGALQAAPASEGDELERSIDDGIEIEDEADRPYLSEGRWVLRFVLRHDGRASFEPAATSASLEAHRADGSGRQPKYLVSRAGGGSC